MMADTNETRPPLEFAYDRARDVLTVAGVEYSGDFFRRFGDAMPEWSDLIRVARVGGVLWVLLANGTVELNDDVLSDADDWAASQGVDLCEAVNTLLKIALRYVK